MAGSGSRRFEDRKTDRPNLRHPAPVSKGLLPREASDRARDGIRWPRRPIGDCSLYRRRNFRRASTSSATLAKDDSAGWVANSMAPSIPFEARLAGTSLEIDNGLRETSGRGGKVDIIGCASIKPGTLLGMVSPGKRRRAGKLTESSTSQHPREGLGLADAMAMTVVVEAVEHLAPLRRPLPAAVGPPPQVVVGGRTRRRGDADPGRGAARSRTAPWPAARRAGSPRS